MSTVINNRMLHKMKNPFKLNSAISTATSVFIAGAGSAAVDWALKKYDVLPADWGQTAVNIGKIVAGALVGSAISSKKYGFVKSMADGVATVAAANLVADYLPEGTAGLPEGTIGRLRVGQRGFRRPAKRVAGADFMAE